MIIFENKHYYQSLLEGLNRPEWKQNTHFWSYLTQQRINDYADFMVVNVPHPRYLWYTDTDFDLLQYKITKYYNSIIDRLGYEAINIKSPLLRQMSVLSRNISTFSFLFDMVLAIFVCISVLLIHSLIMIKVETKTFETGIMRMIGVN